MQLAVLLLGFCAASVASQQFSTGFANPNKNVNLYVFAADPLYSATSLPGTIYVFRQGTTLESTPIPNQRNILTTGGSAAPDIRQVVIVVEPSGVISPEITTEAGIGTRTKITVSNTFCHCPAPPAGFSYGAAAHATQFPTRTAFFSNGVQTSYIDFGIVASAAPGRLFRQRDPSGNFVAWLVENVPGDTGYTPMRELIDVTVTTAATSLAGLSGLVQSASGTFYHAPVVSVVGSDAAAEVVPLRQGWYATERVHFYEFSGSRLTTSVASSTGVRAATLFVISGQDVPVASSTPGLPDYSDLWHIVYVTPNSQATASLPITSASNIPSAWTRTVSGTYINCPIVNANTSLQVPSHARSATLYYAGASKICLNFSWTPGCGLRGVFRLQRDGDRTFVEGNDLFKTAPTRSLDYSPMSWAMPFVVPQQYATNTFTAATDLTNPPAIAANTGSFTNRIIVSTLAAETFTFSEAPVPSGVHRLTVEWSFLGRNEVRIRLSCRSCHGYVAIGFGVPGSLGHEGYFVAGYLAQDGFPCVRKLVGSSIGAAGLVDGDTNVLNVSKTQISVLPDGGMSFTFSRSIVVQDEVFGNFSIDVASTQRVMFATRKTTLLTCNSQLTDFAHDNYVEKSWSWARNTSSTAAPTQSPPSVFTAAPPLVETRGFNASTYVGFGTYRMDSIMTMSWNISIESREIEFTFLVANQLSGWIGFGFGAQMAGADIMTAYRTHRGQIAAQDRKGTGQFLPLLDLQQDVSLDLALSETPGVFVLRRKLDTGDRLDSALPPTRTLLSRTSYAAQYGWAHGVKVAYYQFGNGPSFGKEGGTAAAVMYVMQNATGSLLSFQRDLIGAVPGQPGYSDWWQVVRVTVPSNFEGPEIRSVTEIPRTWEKLQTLERINCPVTHESSTINTNAVAERLLWYKGTMQKCFQFPSANAASGVPQRVVFLMSNRTNVTIEALFDTTLDDINFSPFVWAYVAHVPANYRIGQWTSIDLFVANAEYPLEALSEHANLPQVSPNSVTETNTNSPVSVPVGDIDPAVLASYDHYKQLAENTATGTRVDLYWTYNDPTQILDVMVIGHGIAGYVAIGFSNSSYSNMQATDIVMGYLDPVTAEGCVRTMYGEFEFGAPSSTPTLLVRNARISQASGATILRFERTFTGNAHGAGVIPRIVNGATSRVTYATLRGAVTENCTSQNFANLYHGTSPHGSVEVNWLGDTSPAPPNFATLSPDGSILLQRFDLARTNFYFRSRTVPAYCAPLDVPYAGGEHIGTPRILFILNDATNAEIQAPVVETFAGRPGYTGMWRSEYLRVPVALTSNWSAVTNFAAISSLGLANTTNSTFLNCPAVDGSTTVEPRDASFYPKLIVYFDDQRVTCIMFDRLSSLPSFDMQWNVSSQSQDIIDSVTRSFRIRKNVQAPSNLATGAQLTGAESVAELAQFDGGGVRNCVVVKHALPDALRGAQTQPSPQSFSLQRGFFNGRAVTFFKVQSAQRFANRDEIQVNRLYALRNGRSLTSPVFQAEFVASVANGNGTYSDIWQVVVVDASSRVAGSMVTSTSWIDTQPSANIIMTEIYMNCPMIPADAVFTGGTSSVTTKQILVNGERFTCANFGMVPKPPTRLPVIYDVFSSAGAEVENGDIFQSTPGLPAYYPLHWVVKANLNGGVPVGLQSTRRLNETLHAEVETYRVWNIYILTVSEGSAETQLGNMTLTTGDILERSGEDAGAIMAAPQATDIATVGTPRTLTQLSTVYVFRRGLTIDTDAVALMDPVVTKAPGMVSYTATSGSDGYTDVHRVVVIRVPDNFTEVLRDAAAIDQRVLSGALSQNASTGLHGVFFVNVNVSAVTSNGVSCPRADVHFSGTTYPSLSCGFFPASTFIEYPTLSPGKAAGLLSRDPVGASVRVGVSLLEFARNLVQDFTANPIPTFAGGYPAMSFNFNITGTGFAPGTLPRAKKYVFRHGPSMHGSPVPLTSGGDPIWKPVIEHQGATANGAIFADVHEVIVVNVGPRANLPVAPPSVTSVATLLRQLESSCWSLHHAGVVHVGPVLVLQNQLTPRAGLTTEIVTSQGIQYRHAVVSVTVLAELTGANAQSLLAVVEVRNSATGAFSHFVIPSADAKHALSHSIRALWRISVPDPALIVNMTNLSPTNTGSSILLFTSFVSNQLYTPPPQPQTLVRQTGYYDKREAYYYDFGTWTNYYRASLPTPLYTFTLTNELGGVITAIGTPVVGTLPGHATYNDLHQVYSCFVPEREGLGTATPVPMSALGVQEALLSGRISRCTAGEVRNIPIVHSLTTINSDDLHHAIMNPTGASYVAVMFDHYVFRGIDFGPVTIAFNPSADFAFDLRYTGTGMRVLGNAVFNTADTMGRDSITVSPLKRLTLVSVPDTYVPGSTKNMSDLLALATEVLETNSVANWPIVRMDSELPELLRDDMVISDRPMDIVWAYGDMQVYPIEMLQHRSRGSGWINFFTGETDQSADPPMILLSPRSIQFGCCFRLTWWLEGPKRVRGPDPTFSPAAATAAPRRAAITPTYAPSETNIVFEFRALTDVWCAMGLSDGSGQMLYADMIMGYARPPGLVNAQAEVFLTERRGDNYTEPRIVPDTPLRLRTWETHGNGSGWTIVMERPVVVSHSDLRSFEDSLQNVVWAVGEWGVQGRPSRHFERGKARINFISGFWVLVPQTRVSFWYVAVLLAVILLTFAAAFGLRQMDPGQILWKRPFAKNSTNPWTQMVVGELIVLFLIVAMIIIWIVGSWLDLRSSRAPHPVWQAFGRGTQFIMYFVLFPLPRTNLILHALGSTFHKAMKWFKLLLIILVLLGWIHGIAVLIALPKRTSDYDWWAGIVAVVVITLWTIVNLGVLPVGARAQYLLHWGLFLLVLVFVHLHVPWTVFGMIPSFLHILVDWVLRWKDRQNRVGRVRSHAMVSERTVAVEVRVRSPWHSWCLRPFSTKPGAFVFAQFTGWNHHVPLCVSSRPLQEPTEEFALFSFHVRCSPSDVAIGRNAAKNPDHASVKNFPQWTVAECESDRLANCAVSLEGPYGGSRLNLKNYRTLILVAGGIGIANVMPLLEALTYDADYFRRTEITMIKLVWVVHHPEDFLMFASEIVDVLRSVRPFGIELYLHATRATSNPIPSFADDTGLNIKGADVHSPAATPARRPGRTGSSPGSDGDGEGALPVKHQGGALVPTAEPYADIRNVPRHPLFMKTNGIGLDITPRRPDFIDFFAAEKDEAIAAEESARAVFVSGPAEMIADVMASAAECSEWGRMAFHVDFDQFRLR